LHQWDDEPPLSASKSIRLFGKPPCSEEKIRFTLLVNLFDFLKPFKGNTCMPAFVHDLFLSQDLGKVQVLFLINRNVKIVIYPKPKTRRCLC